MRIYSQDRVIEIGREKGIKLIMRSGKRQMAEGIELSNQENHNPWRKGKLQVLGNNGSRHHQTRGDRKNRFKIAS